MTTKYAILNPTVGEYEYVDSQEKALIQAQDLAWQMYLTYTHGAPISQVDTDDAGVETWSAFDTNTL
jgi:hypothetical protein